MRGRTAQQQLVAFFHARAFDAAQHVEVASGEYLSKAPGIHPAGNRKPDLGVGPCSRLPARQLGRVRQKRRSGVKAHAVLPDRRETRVVPSEEPQRVVRYAASGPEQHQ